MIGRPAMPPAAAGGRREVVVHLPGVLAAHTGGSRHLQVPLSGEEPTVGAVLNALGERHPGVRQRVLDDQGGLRPHVNVFVGGENVRLLQGLATPVLPADQLWVIPAVSGGASPPRTSGAAGTTPREVLGGAALARAARLRRRGRPRAAGPA